MNTTYFGSAVRTRRLQQNWLILWSVGQKATATLLRDFEYGGEPVFPKPGQLWVLINGAGDPLSVVRTAQVDIVTFGDVDAAFALGRGRR